MTIRFPSNPSPAARAACDDLAFEVIVEAADLARSYAVSASEAAWRGDRRLLAGHLAQLRASTIAALDAFNALAPDADELERAE